MAEPISFDPYLGWVDVENADSIPQEARLITAADLIRYESWGVAGSEAINELLAFATDAQLASMIANAGTATGGAVLAAALSLDTVRILTGDISNDSAVQLPAGLSVPVTANSTWELEADLFYNAGTANDLKLGWSFPAGTSGRWGVTGLAATNTVPAGGEASAQSAPIASTLGLGGTGAASLGRVRAVATFTADGAIGATYAPVTIGTPVTLYQHSTLRARRIS